MFCRKVCIFLVLWTCANIEKSTSLTRHSHKFPNGILQKSISAFENGRTLAKTKLVRRAVAIVDENFEIPSPMNNHETSSETVVIDEYEGSGLDDDFGRKESDKTTNYEDKLKSEYLTRTSTTQTTFKQTTNVIKMTVEENQKISTLSNEESSGDGIYLFTTKPSTTEITTESRDKPRLVVEETIPDICLNSSCSANDLSVSASDHRGSVAEGTNFTFSCKSNSSNHMLYWYKSNGSVNFLKAFGTEENLNFNIPDTKPVHSGKYMCVKWVDKQNCCHLQSDLTVYELPLYKYHITIIALIAAVCLIICISLSVRRLITLKTYTKQFVEKHGNVKNQLLT